LRLGICSFLGRRGLLRMLVALLRRLCRCLRAMLGGLLLRFGLMSRVIRTARRLFCSVCSLIGDVERF
jgi:hypothetical protein